MKILSHFICTEGLGDEYWMSHHSDKIKEWMCKNHKKYQILSSKTSYPVKVSQYSSGIYMATEIQYMELEDEEN